MQYYDAAGNPWTGKSFINDIVNLGIDQSGKANVRLFGSPQEAKAFTDQQRAASMSDAAHGLVAGPGVPGSNSYSNMPAFGNNTSQQQPKSTYQPPQPFQSAPAMGGMWPVWSGVNSSGPAWQGNQFGNQWSTPGMRSSPYGGYSSYGGGLLGGGSVQYRRGLLG